MATLKDTAALGSLNEQDYLNKLYDSKADTQNQTLQENYNANLGELDTAQQTVQQQTAENLQRTEVEAQKAQQMYQQEQIPKVSAGAGAQAALTQNNQKKKNYTELQEKEAQADAEIERQRQIQGQQYAAAIKEAQANNDMAKAQALYNAAKAEDEQWLALKQQAGQFMAGKGDTSINEALLAGTAVPENAIGQGETWDSVLKYADQINAIYDNQAIAQNEQLAAEFAENMSDLEKKRADSVRETDEKLTDAYVDALRSRRNENETSTAYGRGSGTAAQARLARDSELQQTLTDLRGVGADAVAGYGMEGYDLSRGYRDSVAKAEAEREQARVDALFAAAEGEEAKNLEVQQNIAQQLAAKGDYSVLGRLYGLSEEQIAKLMGRGKYAPAYYGPEQPKDGPGDGAGFTGIGGTGYTGKTPGWIGLIDKTPSNLYL
jgi:hypothetical protein